MRKSSNGAAGRRNERARRGGEGYVREGEPLRERTVGEHLHRGGGATALAHELLPDERLRAHRLPRREALLDRRELDDRGTRTAHGHRARPVLPVAAALRDSLDDIARLGS